AFVNTPVSPLANESTPLGKALVEKNLMFLHWPTWYGTALYSAAVLAAVMTAFYMFRLFFLTFFGKFRGWEIGRPSRLARQSGGGERDHDDLSMPGYPPHESPWQMTVPLIILGTCAAVAGVLNMPLFHFTPMDHWLDPVFKTTVAAGVK